TKSIGLFPQPARVYRNRSTEPPQRTERPLTRPRQPNTLCKRTEHPVAIHIEESSVRLVNTTHQRLMQCAQRTRWWELSSGVKHRASASISNRPTKYVNPAYHTTTGDAQEK